MSGVGTKASTSAGVGEAVAVVEPHAPAASARACRRAARWPPGRERAADRPRAAPPRRASISAAPAGKRRRIGARGRGLRAAPPAPSVVASAGVHRPERQRLRQQHDRPVLVGRADGQRLREAQRDAAVDRGARHGGEVDAVHQAVVDLDDHRLRSRRPGRRARSCSDVPPGSALDAAQRRSARGPARRRASTGCAPTGPTAP